MAGGGGGGSAISARVYTCCMYVSSQVLCRVLGVFWEHVDGGFGARASAGVRKYLDGLGLIVVRRGFGDAHERRTRHCGWIYGGR